MDGMKQVQGFWLPENEAHLVTILETSAKFFKGPTYQVDKLLACIPYIKHFETAIDIGAHCGLWSRVLVKMFKKVHAIEPIPLHANCFARNVPEATLHNVALSNKEETLTFKSGANSSGDTRVMNSNEEGQTFVTFCTTLDKLKIDQFDFVKIDCEGFEKFIIEGGESKIKSNKPCIIVEQKSGMADKYGLKTTEAVDLLRSWGAVDRFDMAGDYCMSWA